MTRSRQRQQKTRRRRIRRSISASCTGRLLMGRRSETVHAARRLHGGSNSSRSSSSSSTCKETFPPLKLQTVFTAGFRFLHLHSGTPHEGH